MPSVRSTVMTQSLDRCAWCSSAPSDGLRPSVTSGTIPVPTCPVATAAAADEIAAGSSGEQVAELPRPPGNATARPCRGCFRHSTPSSSSVYRTTMSWTRPCTGSVPALDAASRGAERLAAERVEQERQVRRPLVRGGTELGQRQHRDGELRDQPGCLPCAERLGVGAPWSTRRASGRRAPRPLAVSAPSKSGAKIRMS